MALSTSTMIFIGNLPIIDIDESDWDTENAGALIGTYDKSAMQMVDILNNDSNNDGAIYDDEGGTGEVVSYTLDQSGGSSSYTGPPDATVLLNAVVTETDGTTHSIQVLVIQMPNGDTFIGDLFNAGDMDNLQIDTIELVSVDSTNYAGYFTSQTISGTTVCFAQGTHIAKPCGEVRVEDLRVGDLVMTRDDGPMPLRWIGRAHLQEPAQHAPIEISQGALGQGLPWRPLRLSPQHRVLVASKIALRMFDQPEVLVAAKRLCGLPGISQTGDGRPVHYLHLSFDRHQVIYSEGAPTESLYLGQEALKTLTPEARNELSALFPDVFSNGTSPDPARHVPPNKRQKKLVARHMANGKTLLDLLGTP